MLIDVYGSTIGINAYGLELWMKHFDDKIINREVYLMEKRLQQLREHETFDPSTEFIDLIPNYATPAFMITMKSLQDHEILKRFES